MSSPLDTLRDTTRGSPYEGRLWMVGGAVRDELLGSARLEDIDIVLEGDSLAAARFLNEAGVAQHFPVEYPRFGTAMVTIGGTTFEFVTARKESYDGGSRKPHVEPATLFEDAQRRDFTVNALLRNIHTGELYDPLGSGLNDLGAGILRTPLDPLLTFQDDPLRMLRAVRFRHRLGFAFSEGLAEAIRASVERLSIVSAERIRDEWLKMLSHPTASEAMQDLLELGLVEKFIPEFLAGVGMDHGRYHHLDVWRHTLLVLRNIYHNHQAPSRRLALAALFHDIAKPTTRTFGPDGSPHFYQHERVGAEMTREILGRLRFGNQDVAEVAGLVRHHMRFADAKHFSDSAARRVIRDVGDLLPDLLDLVDADRRAHHPDLPTHDLEPVRRRLEKVAQETPKDRLVSPLDGQAIMKATGLAPGPQIGRLKQALNEMVLEGTIAPDDQAGALRALHSLLA